MTFATYGEHNPSHVQRHALLSQLYDNFQSITYFFPSYETCSITVNSLFLAAIKNLHVKANDIFVFLLLRLPLLTTTISEGITHTRKNTFIRPTITNIILVKGFLAFLGQLRDRHNAGGVSRVQHCCSGKVVLQKW